MSETMQTDMVLTYPLESDVTFYFFDLSQSLCEGGVVEGSRCPQHTFHNRRRF